MSRGTSRTTLVEKHGTIDLISNPDTLWETVFRDVTSQLSPEALDRLSLGANSEPFTSTQVFDTVRPLIAGYTNRTFQKLITKLEPVLSHIGSFADVINVFVQSNPKIAGLVWGGLFMVIQVALRSQQTLDQVMTFLEELGPQLGLFQRWRRLFPDKSFAELNTASRKVYKEMAGFLIEAIRYLKRPSAANFFYGFVNAGLCEKYRKRKARIQAYTARLKAEVELAHMSSVKNQLASLGDLMDALPGRLNSMAPLPVVRIIPHSRNGRFFGREKTLSYMDKILRRKQCQKRQELFALYGLGGSGKTQIALQYTYLHLDDFDVVIWILADNAGKIEKGFIEAATSLGLERIPQNVNHAKEYVLQRLAVPRANYLLVFDNADDLSLLNDCFPKDNHGSIIFTSRNSVSSEELASQGEFVDVFSVEEGRDFLSSLLPKAAQVQHQDDMLSISRIFDGYPLAVSQVAAYIRTRGCSTAQFLEIYADQLNSLQIASLHVKDYQFNLQTVWDLSFASLTSDSRAVLEILVYLDPDNIPSELFIQHLTGNQVSHLGLQHVVSPTGYLEAVQGLRSQSLIRINKDSESLSIHRFFQERAFQALCRDPTHRRRAFERALELLRAIHPEYINYHHHWSTHYWGTTEKYLQHIRALKVRYYASPEIFQGLEEKLAGLLYQCSVYLFERNRYRSCAKTLATVREILAHGSNADVLLLSDCHRVEGRLCNEDNRPDQAIKNFTLAKKYAEEAIAMRRMEKYDGRMVRILTGWGNALNQLEQWDEALDLQMQALELCKAVPTRKSDAIFIVRLNWGFLLCRRNELDEAEEILKATLDDDPGAPATMVALANTYQRKGNLDEAIALHSEAFRIYKSMFGEKHHVVANELYKVGELLGNEKGEWHKARELLRRALTLYESQKEHFDIRRACARNTRMLARAEERCGAPERARELYEKAWNLREAVTGIRGSEKDTDADYTALMFYWCK